MTERPTFDRWLNIGTALFVVLAVAVLVRERILPAWRGREVVAVGDRVPGRLRYQALASGDTLSVRPPAPSIHFLFRSDCPACGENLPAWRSVVALTRGVRTFAVGFEPQDAALEYVRRELDAALAVRPVHRDEYVRILGIAVVPTTLVLDATGRLVWRRSGPLSEHAVASLVGAVSDLGAGEPRLPEPVESRP